MRHHPLPFDTGEDEKILGPLTLAQTGWIAVGFFFSYQLAKVRLPFPGLLGYLHALLPMLSAVVMGFVTVNNVPIPKYLNLWYTCRKRKRIFIYRK